MSNLLPLETKNSIKKEYHLRVVATVLFLLGAILLVSVAWLAPVYILSVNKYDVTQSELVVVQAEISNKQPDNPRETINDINSKLEILKGDDFTKHYAYDIVKDIVEQKNKEIEIESIIYDKSTTDIKVLLRGNALSRESLSS
ncbi:MAG TPA: hypothetical protein ENI61_02485, partial [Ignavibacteria bacterium]|nr:hypothetical protein [Ignavibacteria bacterium]